jgi:hypothetical protein
MEVNNVMTNGIRSGNLVELAALPSITFFAGKN